MMAAGLPGIEDVQIAGALRAGERVFLSGASALSSGKGLADGSAGKQTHAALDQLEASLASVGGSLANITKLTTCIVDRGYRADVYRAIAERLPNVHPVSTGLVVAGLPAADLIVQIDAEAAIPAKAVRHIRPYSFDSWHGQGFAWQGSMVLASDDEYFVRGQTGAALDHSGTVTKSRSVASAGRQADVALANLVMLLGEAGASVDDICKMTVYIGDRAYRQAVYPMIGKHLAGVHPVSTGIVTSAFTREDILFEIDVTVVAKVDGRPHRRLRPYHSNSARYGTQRQPLDVDLCMAVVAGNRVMLRGQTGVGLDERFYGAGDAAVQAAKAMDNVSTLLAEAGTSMRDVVKATIYVTDRAYLAEVNPVIMRHLDGARPALTNVIVKGLASPELLMEVDVAAIKADAR
jgi:enamine deaminase RidA (YjgF/YER057c/UK114 family)